ncbi:MAG: hypothetical protein ACI8Z5_000583 [Lentimonas sp.]|jgi:hypothetical protein
MFTNTSTSHVTDQVVTSSSPFWRPVRLLRHLRQTSVVVSTIEPKPTAVFRLARLPVILLSAPLAFAMDGLDLQTRHLNYDALPVESQPSLRESSDRLQFCYLGF